MIILILLFLGGFIAVFCCLLYATIYRKRRAARRVGFIGAFCGLVYEGGCFAIVNGVGDATGGGGGNNSPSEFFWGAVGVVVIWSIIILALSPANDKEKANADKGAK